MGLKQFGFKQLSSNWVSQTVKRSSDAWPSTPNRGRRLDISWTKPFV